MRTTTVPLPAAAAAAAHAWSRSGRDCWSRAVGRGSSRQAAVCYSSHSWCVLAAGRALTSVRCGSRQRQCHRHCSTYWQRYSHHVGPSWRHCLAQTSSDHPRRSAHLTTCASPSVDDYRTTLEPPTTHPHHINSCSQQKHKTEKQQKEDCKNRKKYKKYKK